MTEILKTIELIEDKRQEKKVRHKLLDIVVIVLLKFSQSLTRISSGSTLDWKMASLRMTQCKGSWAVLRLNICRAFIISGMSL